ncbi:hypothetical protein M758_UG249300, partial [Ceratodon purpureus]
MPTRPARGVHHRLSSSSVVVKIKTAAPSVLKKIATAIDEDKKIRNNGEEVVAVDVKMKAAAASMPKNNDTASKLMRIELQQDDTVAWRDGDWSSRKQAVPKPFKESQEQVLEQRENENKRGNATDRNTSARRGSLETLERKRIGRG